MNKVLQVIFLIASCSLLMCRSNESNNRVAPTILFDQEFLTNTKLRIEKGDIELKQAFDKLIEEAEMALTEGPYSVTDKTKLPPSSDKHDYASYSRYWWPDPNKPNGLPYIRRDGETNPSSQSLEESDRPRIGSLGMNTETLGLAYYLTGEEKYAKKAAELLRIWFLDSNTHMNPNLNHAQCRPGHNNGTKSGVLDGRLMIRALEGSLLIEGSNALSKTEQKKLKDWAGEYFHWLTTSEMALQEAASKNNHGSFYDIQVIYFALYAVNIDAATKVADEFVSKRIYAQIQPDGSMPEEIARTRPLFYSIFNLHAMFLVANMAERVNVDIWRKEDKDARLRKGLDFLVPYSDINTEWPDPFIGKFNRMELLPILQMANRVYPNGNYYKMVDKLPVESRKRQRSNLAIPLMR